MLEKLRKFFSPPVFEDKDKTRSARILNIILWAAFALLLVSRIISFVDDKSWWQRLTNPISLFVVIIAMLILALKRGYVRQTSFVLLATAWAALSFQAYTYQNGIYDSAFIGTILLILLAGLLLDFRYSVGFAMLAILTGWALAYYQTTSGIPTKIDSPLSVARDYTIIFTLLTIITYLIISGLQNALTSARESEQKQTLANSELRKFQASLEHHVATRTQELQLTTAQLEKRAKELEAVSEISRTITSIQDLDTLLTSVVGLVSSHFGYYQTGIFILDETAQNLVLRAASSEGGRRMLARKFSLRVGTESLVGFAASRGIPRVALDVENDPLFLPEPDLLETKSEATFPLLAGKQIIGVLDVESTDKHAFAESEVKILGTLANQIAISIQNVRSFNETRRALAESEKIYQRFVEQGWKRVTSEAANMGYIYTTKGVNQLNTPISAPEIQTATASGNLVVSQDEAGNVVVPVKLRGQVLGVLNIRSTDEAHKWDEDELSLIQAAADRAAMALENARLLDESQRRASKERTIGELSARISAATNINSIMQTAVTEIGHTIGGSEVSIQFRKPRDS